MSRKKAKIKPKKKQMKATSAASKRRKNSTKNVKTRAAKKALKKKTAVVAVARRSGGKKSRGKRKEEVIPPLRRRNPAATISGAQTGDLQGVSRVQEADSESVEELVEEGNPFEAGAVAGVEEADNADESEVHTHEVAEDDVPEEYLDQD